MSTRKKFLLAVLLFLCSLLLVGLLDYFSSGNLLAATTGELLVDALSLIILLPGIIFGAFFLLHIPCHYLSLGTEFCRIYVAGGSGVSAVEEAFVVLASTLFYVLGSLLFFRAQLWKRLKISTCKKFMQAIAVFYFSFLLIMVLDRFFLGNFLASLVDDNPILKGLILVFLFPAFFPVAIFGLILVLYIGCGYLGLATEFCRIHLASGSGGSSVEEAFMFWGSLLFYGLVLLPFFGGQLWQGLKHLKKRLVAQ